MLEVNDVLPNVARKVVGVIEESDAEIVRTTMLDTTIDTTTITRTIVRLIRAGIPEGELLVRVMRQFPDLTWRDLSQALQVAQAAAERKALRAH
jgi:hypothetical protein